MKIKVEGGTSRGENLCNSCKAFKKVVFQDGNDLGFCGNLNYNGPLPLHGDVADCSMWEDKNNISLYELKEKAWIIEITKSRKIGFVSPLDRNRRQKDEMDNL